ncbi:restriction endonuclease subunit S [Priestia megaterium]|uniref:restriction endonuclease subunit S n=1 Tax=Priestia megaterium TaxID=1404 RepID=UPI0021AD36AF|nr:restriction endonuclease subunit S [Priestia megaterium]MCR8927505.1 restriction endonuclease subunit S [Priestia megaterium]
MLLGDIAEIKTGLVLSRKKADLEYNVQAQYQMITLKNIEDDGYFNEEPFEEFHSQGELGQQYFTTKGDILIRLSYPNTAIFIDENYENLLVPSYFVIVKIKNSSFSPEYVAWLLNTEAVKKELERSQAGTRILSTNKNVLRAIDIKEISLEKQQVLLKINSLHQREKRLYKQLIKEKGVYLKNIMQMIVQEKVEE